MAELLIRAYSLYSEAERTTQRVVTELIQVGAALFPGHAAAATAAIALGGFIGGSLAEGGSNGIHALDATAWAQEGLMSGLASKVAGIGGLKGALSTDEVNRAAGGIASVTAPLYGAFQGDALARSPSRNTARPTARRNGWSRSPAPTASSIRRSAGRRTWS